MKHAPLPHKLALYRAAVQHPQAEVAFLHRAYQHYRGRDPVLLREDFAGTAAVAASWVGVDEDHQALAIDSHSPTLRWAMRQAGQELGDRAGDLHFIHADVMEVAAPRVDVLIALNFSSFIYHDRASLRAYFRNARKSLRTGGAGGSGGTGKAPSRQGGAHAGGFGGILVIDAYGGPGALTPQIQSRPAYTQTGIEFTYLWEQKKINAVTGLVDNRIHFKFPDGRSRANAFRYHWRLWTLPEIVELMLEAGFAQAQVWCDQVDPETGQSEGDFAPIDHLREREDWVAYIIGVK